MSVKRPYVAVRLRRAAAYYRKHEPQTTAALLALAAGHEAGSLLPCLQVLRTRTAIRDVIFRRNRDGQTGGYHWTADEQRTALAALLTPQTP